MSSIQAAVLSCTPTGAGVTYQIGDQHPDHFVWEEPLCSWPIL
jgi:hypothetical protein